MSVPRQDRFSSWASRHREAHALSQPLGRANLYWKLSLLWSIQLQIRQGWSQHRQFLRHGLRDPLEYGRTTWQHDMNVQNLTGCQRRTPLPMKFGKNHLSTKRKRSAPTGMMFLSGNSKFFFLLTTRLCRTNSCGCQRGHFGNSTLWRNTSKSSENGANVIKSPSRSQNQRNMTVLLRKCWCAALLRMSSQFMTLERKCHGSARLVTSAMWLERHSNTTGSCGANNDAVSVRNVTGLVVCCAEDANSVPLELQTCNGAKETRREPACLCLQCTST